MATLFERPATEWIVREPAPSGAEIHQLTSCPAINDHEYFEVPYMDASSRYVFFTRHHDSVGPTALWRADLERRLLSRVAECRGRMRGQGVSPDQRFFYYIDLQEGGGAYTLFRLDMATLESSSWEFDGALLPRTRGSVTPDGRYYINSAYLGNRRFGLWRCDLQTGERRVIWEAGQDMCNAHPQVDPAGTDIMIQHNRGAIIDDTGRHILLVGEIGATLYLVDINGQNHRTLPVGQPFTQRCQGHQCWIGRSTRAITSTGTRRPAEQQIIAGRAAPYAGHVGLATPGGWRNDMTRSFASPHFHHFATDIAGRTFISDWRFEERQAIYLAHFPNDDEAPLEGYTYLCDPRSSWKKESHVHPFLSPDGSHGFFNSDESGTLQAYMVCGW